MTAFQGTPRRQWNQSLCLVRRGCGTRAWFSSEKRQLRGHPVASPAPTGGDRRGWRRCSWALHSIVWWDGERQQHKLKYGRLRLEIRRNLFPMRTAQWWGWGPGRLRCLHLRVFHIPAGWSPEQSGLSPPLSLLGAGAGNMASPGPCQPELSCDVYDTHKLN